MSARGSFQAVVVGGGVVGATLALALARQGREVALVEAREPPPWDPAAAPDLRVFAIAPASAALLQEVGAWPAVLAARVQPYRHMQVWDAAAGAALQFDAGSQGMAALGWIAEQSLLQHALWSALQHQANVVRYCPDAVEGLEQREGGVTLLLASGRRVRADVAIAADGGASRLRALAGIAVRCHDYHQRGVVAFVDTERPHAGTAWQRFLPGGPLAFLPFADGRSSIVWSLPQVEAERALALPVPQFLAELERAFDARLGAITGCSERAAFPLRRQLAATFLSGRVVLAGDAAHVVHPLAGQGVNLGLQDAGALAAAFSSAAQPQRVPAAADPLLAALRRYARARRSDTTVAAYAFEAINRGFSNDALLPTLLRGHLLGVADRLGPFKRLLVERAAGWS